MTLADRMHSREFMAPGAADGHPGLEPSCPPHPLWAKAERAARLATTIKTIGTVLVAFAAGTGTAYAWARSKADVADISAVAKSDAAAHEQLTKEQRAWEARVASLEGSMAVLIQQNGQILHLLETLNDRDVRRGTPTRFPLQEPK